MIPLLEKCKEMMNVDSVDEETTRTVERLVIVRISTKHINLWMRQLEMKRKEIKELAGLMELEDVQEEIEKAKNLERWAKTVSNHFTRKTKKRLFEEIDNLVWSGNEPAIEKWCQRNKVYDKITDDEIEEIWHRETPDDDANIRLNGKYVWDIAKRVCEFLNTHEDLIKIGSFGEYRVVMKKVTMVIKEAHNVERKRRQTSRKKMSEEVTAITQKAKTLIFEIRRGGLRKEDVVKRLENIFGEGSGKEIEKATTSEKIVERVEEMSKREEQFALWEKMRREFKKKQREDRRLNVFWRKNKTFPVQYDRNEETPETVETLEFWRNINNKEATNAWREDESIQAVIKEMREMPVRRGRCRWGPFTEEEFDEVLRCTAPWKACGVDSVYSFPIKKCPPIKKAVFQLVKKMVEWKVTDTWDEDNSWLLEGRTILIFKGGDRKDPANYRPITCLPTITKMVTLAIHKRMRKWLFGSVDKSILEYEQRGVRTSQGCKEAVIENLASNVMKRKEKKEVVELYYDFQKAYDNVNHEFLEELLDVYGFPLGIQSLIIEMMSRWKIHLSYGAKNEVGEVRLTNGIIQGDAFSPLLFVLMIDPLIKILKTRLGDEVEILYYMDDLKASTTSIEAAQAVHETVKKFASSVGMVINNKKSAIQLNTQTPLPESLQEIPRLDEITYKYLGFEMRNGEVARNEMMLKLEERIREKLDEPTRRVDVFEARNWIHFINQNVMSVIRFYSGPVKFTLGWLDSVDRTIRQHLTSQGMLMKRGMATSRLYMKPEDMGMGLKSSVGVYLLELVRLLLQYKWGTIYRQEWFWRMEELTKRNGKGAWLREIEKVLRRFDASLEWLMGRIGVREGEIESTRKSGEMSEREKNQVLLAKKMKSIEDVLEEVEILIDAYFFNQFSGTKSSSFLKKVIENQRMIEVGLFKKTWRTLNCSPKTMKVIRETQENILCVGKRKELISKKKTDTKCWCSKSGQTLNAKHIISCCRKVSGEINARHDIIVNILLNNILVQRGLISHEQEWEDRKMVRTRTDEITIGTEHWRSDEWKGKGRVAGAKLKPDLVWLRCDGGEWRKVVVDVKVTSTDKMNDAFKEKDDKYREWTAQETREENVAKAVMVPLIITHDGAVHRDTVRRWNDFAKDIKVDWVRMAQNVLRFNVVIVGKFFNKGSWVSEAWRKDHPEEYEEEPDGPPERIASAEERRLRLDLEPESAVCVRPSGTPPPHDARLTPVGRGDTNLYNTRTNQL